MEIGYWRGQFRGHVPPHRPCKGLLVPPSASETHVLGVLAGAARGEHIGVREVACLQEDLPTNIVLSVPQLHPMRMEQRMPLTLEVKSFSPFSLCLFQPLFVRRTCKRSPTPVQAI